MQLYFLVHVKSSTEYGLTSPSRHYRSFLRSLSSRSMAPRNQNKQQTWVKTK